MILCKPSFEIMPSLSYADMLFVVVSASSVCYNKCVPYLIEESEELIRARIKAGHESVIEHVGFSVMFTVDRGITHEIVRHRLASYTQSSTRYIKQADHVRFIIPPCLQDELPEGTYTYLGYPIDEDLLSDKATKWLNAILEAEDTYHNFLRMGWEPEKARGVLPNATAAKIMVTANMRQWRHIFRLRALGTTGRPHPQMQEVMKPLLYKVQECFPVFFEYL